MNYDGSFWVRCDAKCYSKQAYEENGKLAILSREEFSNISEKRQITRLLIEKYSNNTMAMYVSTATHESTCEIFELLCSNFAGDITILANYGPISLNLSTEDPEFALHNFCSLLSELDKVEYINPVQIRQMLSKLIRVGETIEY